MPHEHVAAPTALVLETNKLRGGAGADVADASLLHVISLLAQQSVSLAAPAARGGHATSSASPNSSARPDALTRRAIAQWRALAHRNGARFSAGLFVPAFAICLCAEQMATRVLQRHCALIGARHPLYPLLAGVLSDEDRHVRLCQHTLARLVMPSEQASLASLLDEIRAIDRAWSVSGALTMYLAGAALRLWPARP